MTYFWQEIEPADISPQAFYNSTSSHECLYTVTNKSSPQPVASVCGTLVVSHFHAFTISRLYGCYSIKHKYFAITVNTQTSFWFSSVVFYAPEIINGNST